MGSTFRSQLTKSKTALWAYLLIVLFVLSASSYNIASNLLFDAGYPMTESWYATVYGEGIDNSICIVMTVLILLFVGIMRFGKVDWGKVLTSKVFHAIELALLTFIIVSAIVLPQNYDVVCLKNDSYVFISHRMGQVTSSYTIDDVSSMQINSSSDMRLLMQNGDVIYIAYGVERWSDGFGYETGQAPYEICTELVNRDIQITATNQERIQREIDKYSARSDINWWHIYMPYILSQAKR